jgi:alpha-tubulin suppressor-like RCC1 family protein
MAGIGACFDMTNSSRRCGGKIMMGTRPGFRAVAVLVALPTVLSAGVSASARGAHGRSAYRVTAHLSTPSFAADRSTVVKGSVRPAAPHRRVDLQRKLGSRWTTISKGRVSGTSTFRFTYHPADAGTVDLRVSVPATKAARAGVSRALAAKVTATPLTSITSDLGGSTCVVVRDGTVRCWGRIGLDLEQTPLQVAGMSHAKAVAHNEDDVCAVVVGGQVECAEINHGIDIDVPTLPPVKVPGITSATAIAAGDGDVCVLLADHTVRCWGDNDDGQLGDGSTGTGSTVPVEVAGIGTATSIAASDVEFCATLADGSVRCWGDRITGATATISSSPVPVGGLTGDASRVSVGEDHDCAVLIGGTVDCWGSDADGQLGDGGTTASVNAVAASGIHHAVSIAAGDGFTCAALSNHTATCWGTDSNGQLGNDADTASGKVAVHGLTTARSLAATASSACALLSTGSAACWGDNVESALGIGTDGGQSDVPKALAPPAWLVTAHAPGGVVHTGMPAHITGSVTPPAPGRVAILRYYDFATQKTVTGARAKLSGRSMYSFRYSPASQYDGDYFVTVAKSDQHSAGFAGFELTIHPDVVSLSAGNDHSCAATNTGQAFCWGDDSYGELGYPGLPDSGGAYPVENVGDVRGVAAGLKHSCAVLTNGHVECWGNNDLGQLGDGLPADSPGVPVNVKGITHATAISAGDYGSCALIADGTVECWGSGDNGELGNGHTGNSDVPVKVSGLSTAIAITTGFAHSCALLKSGSVKCWGTNGNGQLGRGSYDPSGTPVAVANLHTAVAISAGQQHTCALLKSGAIDCWGDNDNGELGSTQSGGTDAPVAVAGISTAVSVSAGGFHTCAVLKSGVVKCWGQGDKGELGNGLNSSSPTPVTVSNLTDITAVSSGFDHSCAIEGGTTHLGDLWCWGNDSTGQLGNLEGVVDGSVPIKVSDD